MCVLVCIRLASRCPDLRRAAAKAAAKAQAKGGGRGRGGRGGRGRGGRSRGAGSGKQPGEADEEPSESAPVIAKAGKSKQHKGSKRGSAEMGDVEAAQMPCAVEAAAPVPASANEVENGERPDEREAKKRRTKKNKYDIDIPTFENFEATQLINNVLFGYCS